MSEELVRRLRESPWCQPMKREAAARIAELEAERDRAEALLKEAVEALQHAKAFDEGIDTPGANVGSLRLAMHKAVNAFLARVQEGRAQGDDDGRA